MIKKIVKIGLTKRGDLIILAKTNYPANPLAVMVFKESDAKFSGYNEKLNPMLKTNAECHFDLHSKKVFL